MSQHTTSDTDQWTTVISSQKGWFDFKLLEILGFIDLIKLLVYRDFVIFFKQTILGPIWWLLQPITTTGVFVIVFSIIGNMSTDGLPASLFYLSGMTVWFYFSNSLTNIAAVFEANATLFSKVYFPRLIIPISILLSNLIKLALQLGFFFICLTIFAVSGEPIRIGWSILLLPLLFLYLGILALGCGLILASLTCKYRDMHHALPFFIQLWMFMSSIIMPRSIIPEHLNWLVNLNPVIPIVEGFRYVTMGRGCTDWEPLLMGTTMTLVLLAVGVVLFHRAIRNVADMI